MIKFLSLAGIAALACAFTCCNAQAVLPTVDLTRTQDYTLHRASSSDPTGGNHDWRRLEPGANLTLIDQAGPGMISHIWITVEDREKYHLKRLVLRMYWDDEATPSVETPLGDFFGLNLGDYHNWESAVLSVGNDHGLNSFFPMPFRKRARITITNEGHIAAEHFFFNIDYRLGAKTADKDSLYFHASYLQAQPNTPTLKDWYSNPYQNYLFNKDGKQNFTFAEATGHGHYVGMTMGVIQNQDDWWGEGDDMFFIDDPTTPAIKGTGAEDYILGAWGFGNSRFAYQTYGAPVKGDPVAGARTVVYRFHLDSPIPFTKYFRGTLEHGSGNHRADNYYAVAYWYQAEPHLAGKPLPPVQERLPALMWTGGPGNGPQQDMAPPPPLPPNPPSEASGSGPTQPTTKDAQKGDRTRTPQQGSRPSNQTVEPPK